MNEAKLNFPEEERKQFENRLKFELSQIIALHPRFELCGVSLYLQKIPNTLTVIDWCTLSMFISTVLCLTQSFKFKWYVLMMGCISSYFSIKYHRTQEKSKIYRYFDVGISSFSLLLFLLSTVKKINSSFVGIFLITSWLYYMGCGRHTHTYRTSRYIIYHSLFHLMMSATLMYGVNI